MTNNVLGTRNVAELVGRVRGTKHFVLISTDKAVRPTNVMGATKRVAEQIVQQIAEQQGKNFVAVRFGNVLGSRGSVVPTFLRQIREGGPITITHPEMRRYFMTIPEAVQLVLQAGALGQGGEVFVLDMGEPLKIVDLANDLIRLSGLEVGDIEIRFSGTRPGEKLYEELFFNSENAAPTSHPKVLRAKNGVLPVGVDAAVDRLLDEARTAPASDELRALLLRLVPDYTPASAPGPRATPGRGLAGAAQEADGVAARLRGCSCATMMIVARLARIVAAVARICRVFPGGFVLSFSGTKIVPPAAGTGFPSGSRNCRVTLSTLPLGCVT